LENKAADFGTDGYVVAQKGDTVSIIERAGQRIHDIYLCESRVEIEKDRRSKSKGCILGVMTNLIALYFYIEERYEKEWKYSCERFSNNKKPAFTDVELVCVYCYVMMEERRFKIKEIHRFAEKYLLSWFPKLPSYQAFNNRVNRLGEVFRQMSAELISGFIPEEAERKMCLVDSLPVIICSGKRRSKVAKEISAKGYCSTKNLWYYGLKIHVLGYRQAGTMPWPQSIAISSAAENDLNVFRDNWSDMKETICYGDRIYMDEEWFTSLNEERNSQMLTPVKAVKGMSERIKQFNKAADDLWSKAVSTVRQPIESLFNWLIERTAIQNASKVRSTKGLIVHVFSRLAVAFLPPMLNS
jgi:hypothetical protein